MTITIEAKGSVRRRIATRADRQRTAKLRLERTFQRQQVGLGKTIDAGEVVGQSKAEPRSARENALELSIRTGIRGQITRVAEGFRDVANLASRLQLMLESIELG